MWEKIKDAFKWLLSLPVKLVKAVANTIVFATRKVAGVFFSIVDYFFSAPLENSDQASNGQVNDQFFRQDKDIDQAFNNQFAFDLAELTMQELNDLSTSFEELSRNTTNLIQNEKTKRLAQMDIDVRNREPFTPIN